MDVYTIPVNGGMEKRLTKGGFNDGPEYSPDGKYIWYNAPNSGLMQVWRMERDGGEQTQITENRRNNWFPHVSPDGKFLYASNRYEANNIAIYSIDGKTGMLKLVGFQDLPGKKPRNFAIDPGGQLLLVANQDSDSITVFKRNMETGKLELLPVDIKAGSPVCLKFVPVGK